MKYFSTNLTKTLILSIGTLISILYCLRFGYIWTGYPHGGQIVGIPFTLVMIIFLIVFLLEENSLCKEKCFYGGLIYFLELGFFSITIELIRVFNKENFEFLYNGHFGWIIRILSGWILLGTASYFWINSKIIKRKN